MLSSVLALTLGAAAMQADADGARQTYTACLRSFMRSSLEQRMDPAAFETAMAAQCTAQADAYRAALVARDARTGGSRARAEEDARMTIDDARANTLEYYREYHASNTMPPQ